MIGKRVLYKKNDLIECWVLENTPLMTVLIPCWRSWNNKRYYVGKNERSKILPYSRSPRQYQHVLIDHYNHFLTEGIIEKISEDYLHIQIPGTKIYLIYHKDSPSIKLVDKIGCLIPYNPIDLESEKKDPYMFANVKFEFQHIYVSGVHCDSIGRGRIIDYDSFCQLYLIHTFSLGINKHFVWLPKEKITLEKINFYVENKPIHVGTYTVPYKSTYKSFKDNTIDEHLILRDMWLNHKWKQKFIKIILDIQFNMYHQCYQSQYFGNHSKEIMLELIKCVDSETSTLYTAQMMNMKKNRFHIECSYRGVPHFTTSVHSIGEDIKLDIYYNNNLTHPLAKKTIHTHTWYIDPVIKGLTNRQPTGWENKDTHKMEFWEQQWNVDIPATNHPILYPHQVWTLSKMIQMEKTQINNILDYNVFGKTYNVLNGFGKSTTAYGGVLALDTGLGKTMCLIHLMKKNPGKTLVVLPLSIIDQWKSEIEVHFPEAYITEYYGKRKSMDGTIVLTTYGTICNFAGTIEVDRVIFDECHVIKSCFSNTALVCSKIIALRRWCVSATPGSISQMATIMALLNVNPFYTPNMGKYMQMLQERNKGLLGKLISSLFIVLKKKHIQNNPIESNIDYEDIEIEMSPMHQNIYKYMYTKCKEEILGYWRENSGMRNYNKIMSSYNKLHMVAMHPNSIRFSLYGKTVKGAKKECLENIVKTMNKSNHQKHVAKNIQNINSETCCICLEPFTRPVITPCNHLFCHECIETSLKHKKKCPQCRQALTQNQLTEIVNKFELVEKENVYSFYYDGVKKEIPKEIHQIYNKEITSNKIVYIINTIKQNPNTSFVIFSQFNTCLNYLQQNINIPIGVINGRTTRKQRKLAIQNFQQKKIRVFLLTTKTSSVGLTLTSSCHMIFMEPLLDKQVFNQAIGRIHRIGQNKNIKVETLYSKHTIEHVENIKKFRKLENSNSRKLKLEYFISI